MAKQESDQERTVREAAERETKEREIFAACQAQYGDCGKYRLKDGTFVVVRGCTEVERVRYTSELSAKKTEKLGPAGPNKTFAQSAIVHPADPQAKLALLNKYPFFNETVCNKAVELSEGQAEDLGND